MISCISRKVVPIFLIFLITIAYMPQTAFANTESSTDDVDDFA